LERIKETVEMRLSEPHLSIADVAVAHRISVRYVQKLFEGAGDSFSHYVRSRRLARCRADLANPLYAHLSISDILFRWGFNDASHFSRAFSAAFGTSPRAYRREAVLQAATDSLHVTRGWPKGTAKTSRAPLVERPAPGGNGRTQRLAKPSIAPRHHRIPANSKTVHWGYFSRGLKPVLQVDSGEVVTIETLTHHAGDDYERMVRGDPGAEDVFLWTKDRKNVERRGSGPMDASIYGRGAGEGFGVHICTGPVAIRGAKPGDVLEVRILDVQLRPCANPRYDGVAFGSNAAAWWGLHYNELLTEPRPREVVTIYRIDPERGDGTPATASAVYNFRWAPQRDPYGVVHSTIDYPGVAVDHATVAERHGVLRDIEIPVFPHFGVIAVAPREAGLVNSVPPSYFGGNIDNRRAGKGATMYLPVGVAGALLSVGDPHAAQGDAELCGTAIECSLTGVFQVIVHERRRLARPALADVSYPLLETAGEWVIHGFSYPNYLSELGDDAQSEIYKKSSLDLAMRDAFRKTRRFLMNFGLSEDEAISLMSVAVDFGITQVVDGNWSVHAVVPKAVLPE
jgi:acetamidase/formamidase/AraC-like DNA-binding protein